MSAQKRLEKHCKNIRVIAMPSRKKEIEMTDKNGVPQKDKNGEIVTESIQLYNIYKLN